MRFGNRAELVMDIFQGGVAVNLRLTGSQQIEIWALNNEN
jgi:hypothetical protein